MGRKIYQTETVGVPDQTRYGFKAGVYNVQVNAGRLSKVLKLGIIIINNSINNRL